MVSLSLLVIRSCVCGTPLPLGSALLSQVYLGSAQRRERNPAGRGDWAQEGEGGVFFSLLLFFLSFFWLRFCNVTDSSAKGSGRSQQRQSQRSSDLVRNAAVLYLFFFFPPPLLSVLTVSGRSAVPVYVCTLLL